jgi:hypothetical protein
MGIRRTVLFAVVLLLLAACTSQPAEPLSCEADDVVDALRSTLGYDEATLTHSVLYETHYLNLWFVDPVLDPSAAGDSVAANTSQALLDAIEAAHALRTASPCVPQLWDGINVVVVDRSYNDWLSGNIAPKDLPDRASLSKGDLKKLGEVFQAGYMRQQPAASEEAPATGSCTWPQVRVKLAGHFDAVEEAAFYLVVEESGAEVWAQWAGPDPQTGTDPMLDALVTVADDLSCLDPQVDTLWVVYTDADQVASLILTVPGEALRSNDTAHLVESIDVVYPAQSE